MPITMMHPQPSQPAFTLAELLISLLILAEIATFTIPKILVAQQNQANNAKVKEAVGAVAAAFQKHQLSGQVTASTRGVDLGQYINAIQIDTNSSNAIDSFQGNGLYTCGSTEPCYRLSTGAVILFKWETFGGTSSPNFCTMFYVDPDGNNNSSSGTAPGKAVPFMLHVNGQIQTWGDLNADCSYDGGGTYGNNPSTVPPWFHW